jgi:hypothetical protein
MRTVGPQLFSARRRTKFRASINNDPSASAVVDLGSALEGSYRVTVMLLSSTGGTCDGICRYPVFRAKD